MTLRGCSIVWLFLVFVLIMGGAIPLIATEKIIQESEIGTVLQYLQARELKSRLRGLLFAHRTSDKRVFEQLVKMYEEGHDIRENVYRAMLRLNQEAKGRFSAELVSVVTKEIDRLKRDAPHDIEKYIYSFLGHVVSVAPDQHFDSFVKWVVSNIDDLCDGPAPIRDELERYCNMYFAAQGDEECLGKLAARFNMPTTNKYDSKLIEIFIARKDPRIFHSLIEEVKTTRKPSVFFVELVMKYAKEMNLAIPKAIQDKMQGVIHDFDAAADLDQGRF
ncbi:MAG TPA: hypothetical protein PLU72_17825 [Candidatus Ozemobacteraceae bacterium]|nr:hypothetical protein [Candidatus Ozemobacteraceae bacterium]HQG27100.1 hypothetical protein [Candidatus Ozemobacteraceae bacterium]